MVVSVRINSVLEKSSALKSATEAVPARGNWLNNIVGNERADYLAKEATKEDPRSTTKSIAYLGTTIKRIQQTEQRQ
ncbi:hypothetical protein A1F96_11275, partial [Pyrenophora tritici-repentis]